LNNYLQYLQIFEHAILCNAVEWIYQMNIKWMSERDLQLWKNIFESEFAYDFTMADQARMLYRLNGPNTVLFEVSAKQTCHNLIKISVLTYAELH